MYTAVFETCEQFTSNKWTLLPSMREARYDFNPCMLLGIIYLCGFNSRMMEAFAPETNTFLPLQIPVPHSSPYCLYVDNHLLVLHSNSYILKFAMRPDGQLTKCSEIRSPNCPKWQNSQPVIDKENGVYFMVYKGKCLSLTMETGVQVLALALE